jgi:cell division septation protein DedD
MRNKETGEFELVVGNGQLVSGFFIVVLLFAVGVAMGYILGQNSEKTVKSQQGDATPCVATDSRPQPAQPAQQQPPQEATAAQSPPATEGQPQGGSDAPPKPTTQPAKEPAPAVSPEPAKQEPAKQEPVKPEPPSPAPAKSTAAAPPAPSGFFWQVSAKSNQESARATLKILKDRGFSAYLVPGPNNLTRVLVGPYKDREAKAQGKSDLEAMGFKPISLNRE